MNMGNIFEWDSGRPLPDGFLACLKGIVGSGGLIVYPTTTLYGLGASIHSDMGVALVNEIKGRPGDMGLSIMATADQIEGLCTIPESARGFMDSGDDRITGVLPALDTAPEALVHSGTVAVRLPCSPLTVSLVECLGPVTATSANVHGMPAPEDIRGIMEQLGKGVSIYIDSGRLAGKPTTLVDYTGKTPKIIREGALSTAEAKRAHER